MSDNVETTESIVENVPTTYTLKVKSVKKDHSQADDSYFLNVEFGIYRPATEGELPDGGEFVELELRSLAFPLDSEEDFIKGELQKYIDLYNAEAKRALENKGLDEANKNVVKLKENLEGLSI